MEEYDNEKKVETAAKNEPGAAGTVNTEGKESVPQARGNNTVRQAPNRVGTNSNNASAPTGCSSPNYQSGKVSGGSIKSRNNPYASAIAFALSGGNAIQIALVVMLVLILALVFQLTHLIIVAIQRLIVYC